MTEESGNNAAQSFRQQVDAFLSAAAPGMEEVVNTESYGRMLSQTAGNLVALQGIGNDVLDLVVRNARVAGRSDVTSLQRQLGRTEDKLEMVLETVERLEEELTEERRRNASMTYEDATEETAAAKRARRSSKSSGQSSGNTSTRGTNDPGE